MTRTCSHLNHSMSDLAGYEVVKTFEGRERCADTVVSVFDAATKYVDALDLARSVRAGGSWAVIYPVYNCGGRSRSPY